METLQHLESLIKTADAKAAHRHLVEKLPQLGLIMSVKTGVVNAVRLHDEHGRYAFSWIVNQGHLLFYIRKPGLNVARHLPVAASQASLPVRENPAGESTIRIESENEARKLSRWLAAELPLPA